MNAARTLNAMQLDDIRRRHPELPCPESFVKKYKTSKANGLQQAIIKFLQLSGWQAERISVTGRMVDQRKTYTDAIGHTRQIGSVKYIKSSQQRGASDISAIIKSKSGKVIPWKIEVKIGKDRWRDDQKAYAAQVERAGGHYSIVKTLDDFMEQYQELINQ